MRTRQNLTILDQKEIASDVFSMDLAYLEGMGPEEIRPGQFVGLYCRDGARLLPRPISICGWRGGTGPDSRVTALRLVYRTVGKGTEEFSHLHRGDRIPVLGILGNGYDLSRLEGRNVLLVGGGIGAPPLLGLAEALYRNNHRNRQGTDPGEQGNPAQVHAVLGYRTNELFLREEFERFASVTIATDDGTAGIHGNVIDAIREREPAFDVICACGPLPMLRGVKALAEEHHADCYLSLEEHMACGIGACLGCVVKTSRPDAHSGVCNARICTEGPVFNAEDVIL